MARNILVSPFVPDRTETLTGTASAFGANDIGKAVELDGDNVKLHDGTGELYGFIAAIEPGTSGGLRVCSVTCDVGREVEAADAAGTLVVGDIVGANAAAAAGTAETGGLAPLAVVAAPAAGLITWRVIRVIGTGAGRKILVRRM